MKMKLKYIVPFLMVLFFVLAPSLYASAPVDAGIVDAVEHEQAVVHGDTDTAVDAHHGSDSLSKEKLMDLFWRVVNFIALMIILVKYCAKPIGTALSGRQEQVKNEIEDLEARRTTAEQEYREFEAKLATVEKDIDSIVDKAIAQAEIEKAKILEKAEQAAADIKRAAEQAIANEVMDAKRSLKNDVADQAAVIAEGLIKKNLNDDDQVKIIEDYLAKVGDVK
ncbi:MAG: F0F1 ATP synthase subunit B [Desulfotalea sp.]